MIGEKSRAKDNQLDKAGVDSAYRALVGRAPTDAELEAGVGKTLDALRAALVQTPDFRKLLWQSDLKFVGTFLRAGPIKIQIEGPQEQFAKMVERIAGYWSGRGETDAEFSVLTNKKFSAENIDENREEFYRLGADDYRAMERFFARTGESLSNVKSAIDFGCGVGRVSAQMATHFDKVVGVDISPGHLRKAEAWFEQNGLSNGQFVHLSSLDVIDSLPEVDLFYSLIVLQHNPPPMIYDMLKRVLARVRPGGYAFFQVPTYRENYSFVWDEYFKTEPKIEMHSLPQRYVFDALAQNGFNVIECHQDKRASTHHMSHTFFAKRGE